MIDYGEEAYQYFLKGYNCSQSVVAPFAADLGITTGLALRLSSGFGGGVGRLREVCGAFCGLVSVISMYYANPEDPADKSRIYAIVQELAVEFKAKNGGNSLICRELLSGAKVPVEVGGAAQPRDPEYYQKRTCPEQVRLAASIAAAYIATHPAV